MEPPTDPDDQAARLSRERSPGAIMERGLHRMHCWFAFAAVVVFLWPSDPGPPPISPELTKLINDFENRPRPKKPGPAAAAVKHCLITPQMKLLQLRDTVLGRADQEGLSVPGAASPNPEVPEPSSETSDATPSAVGGGIEAGDAGVGGT